jgi:uncharacterized protein (DUF58 family)
MSTAVTSPGTARPEALLRRVELRIGRRLDGLLQGERRGRRPGPGGEPSLTRGYEPGDDVRWVDWPLTARMGEPYVRVPELEPVLTSWALMDCSPSMQFGSYVETKLELAQEILAGLGVILRRRGDQLGVVATRTGELDLVRAPRADRRGLIAAIAAVGGLPEAQTSTSTDLAKAVRSLGRLARHRGAVVVMSDFPESFELERSLGMLGRSHEVIAVEVRDRRERELPSIGPMRLRDVETGQAVEVDTSDPKFQERLAQVAAENAERTRTMLARAGARHLVVETGSDWVLPLARALEGRAERRRVAL